MRARLGEQCLVHLGSIGQGHTSCHTVILSVLALQLGIAQQCLGCPQLRCPVGEPFTVHLVGIDVLALLGEAARLGYGLVQSALDSRHDGVGVDECLLSSQHGGLLTMAACGEAEWLRYWM